MKAFLFLKAAAGLAIVAAAGCAGEPFGYAADRCVGSYNQCTSSCASVGDGPARAACEDRCFSSETRCYGVGDEGTALSVESAMVEARNQREKEEAFQRWKAQRERESAEKEQSDEAGAEPVSEE